MAFVEAKEQVSLVNWFRLQYPRFLMFSVPNGGRRDAREAAHLRAQGLVPGVPDLFVAVPRGEYSGLFIEMKRPHRGGAKARVLPCQKNIIAHLNLAGYLAVVCFGFDEAVAVIQDYFQNKGA